MDKSVCINIKINQSKYFFFTYSTKNAFYAFLLTVSVLFQHTQLIGSYNKSAKNGGKIDRSSQGETVMTSKSTLEKQQPVQCNAGDLQATTMMQLFVCACLPYHKHCFCRGKIHDNDSITRTPL